MIENDIYKALKRTFPFVDFQRIETMCKSGIPDLNYCVRDGTEGWIELKIGVPRLKPSQVAWHTRAFAMSRRAYILTYRQDQYQFYRTNKFCPIDMKHFTPLHAPLLRTKNLLELSDYLTKTYN